MSLFPTEAEQIQSLEEADEREFSASFLMEKATDVVLRLGGNNEEIRMELAFDAMIDKPIDEIAAHMRTLYHGGSGFELEGRRFSAWYADNGIYIAGGDRARYANTARIVSWEDAAKRVGERINAGRFGTELENVEAAGFVRRQVASRLIEMYRESFAGENGYLPLIREQEPMIFPDCVNRLFEKMEQPDNLHELIRQVEAFAEAVERQPDLMRMRFFMPDAILPRLRDLTHERRELPKGERELPEVRGFITQDEIDWNLTGGSGYESGAERIELFFSQPHDVGEKIEFLKREYGTGGRMPGVSNARHSEEWPRRWQDARRRAEAVRQFRGLPKAHLLSQRTDPLGPQHLPQPDKVSVAAFFQCGGKVYLPMRDAARTAEHLPVHLAPAGTGVDQTGLPCFQRGGGQHRLEHRPHRVALEGPVQHRAVRRIQAGSRVCRVVPRHTDAGADFGVCGIQHHDAAGGIREMADEIYNIASEK